MGTQAHGGIVPYAMKRKWGCSEVGESQGIPMGCDAFFLWILPACLCSPDRYLAFWHHNPPLHLDANTNTCKYDRSLVSSGLVSFYKWQKSSSPFHEWNRKHQTALLPNKTVCLFLGKYCLADAILQTCIQHPFKGGSGRNGGIVLSHGLCLTILHNSLLWSTPLTTAWQ